MNCPIEFLTNEQLIEELISRDSFAGFIVHADDVREIEHSDCADFKLYGKGFEPEEVVALLSELIERMG